MNEQMMNQQIFIDSQVPDRYRRLVREVVSALPEGWDDHAEWSVEVGTNPNPRGYACVAVDDEAEPGEMVTLYRIEIFPALLDRLTDPACRYVFAHEFGHIASKMRFGSIILFGKPYTKVEVDLCEEAPSKERGGE